MLFSVISKHFRKVSAFFHFKSSLFCCPFVSAMLAYAHRYIFLLELLLFMGDGLDNQRGNGKAYPPSRHPPPADEQPPDNAMMLILELGFSYDLITYIFASTIRTFHFLIISFLFVFWNTIKSTIFLIVSTTQYTIINIHALFPVARINATTAAMMISANISA